MKKKKFKNKYWNVDDFFHMDDYLHYENLNPKDLNSDKLEIKYRKIKRNLRDGTIKCDYIFLTDLIRNMIDIDEF